MTRSILNESNQFSNSPFSRFNFSSNILQGFLSIQYLSIHLGHLHYMTLRLSRQKIFINRTYMILNPQPIAHCPPYHKLVMVFCLRCYESLMELVFLENGDSRNCWNNSKFLWVVHKYDNKPLQNDLRTPSRQNMDFLDHRCFFGKKTLSTK